MAKQSTSIQINLSGRPKKSFAQDFLKWATNIGRVIIVATELIALSALIFRFTIDRKIIDLHDQIKKAELFVRTQEAKEADYRSVQNRLQNIKLIEEETKTKIDIFNDVLASVARGNFQSTNLTVSRNIININGVAFSIFPINDFIETLKQNPNVEAISLGEVTSSNLGIQFKLDVELKKAKNI